MAETNPELNNTIPAAPTLQAQGQRGLGQPNAPVPSGPKKPLLAIVLACLLIIVLAAAGWTYWSFHLNKQANNPLASSPQPAQTESQKLTIQSNSLLAKAQLKFPAIVTITDVTASDTPADIKDFILDGASDQRYGIINYQESKKGFNVRYGLLNSELQNVWVQMVLKGVGNGWLQTDAFSSSLFGYVEFSKDNSSSQMRISLIQKGNDVKVIIQTLVNTTK